MFGERKRYRARIDDGKGHFVNITIHASKDELRAFEDQISQRSSAGLKVYGEVHGDYGR